MNGGIEAAGDFATGTLLGRVAEPGAGEHRHAHVAPERQCLNCGTALTDQYCQRCGQNGHVHRSLGAIGHDLLHGVFHFEGKIWRTLPMLLFRPGELTRRYVSGERARFVSPLAMFLFTVFLLFALFNAVGSGSFSQGVAEGLAGTHPQADAERLTLVRTLAAVDKKRSAAAGGSPERAALDKEVTGLVQRLQSPPPEPAESGASLSRPDGRSSTRGSSSSTRTRRL